MSVPANQIRPKGLDVPMQSFNNRIVEMFSAQGEKVEMEQPVEAKGDEENIRISGSKLNHTPVECTVFHIQNVHSAEFRQTLNFV